MVAKLTQSTDLSQAPTGWLRYNIEAEAFIGAPYDSGWIIQEFVGESHPRGYRIAFNRNDGRVFTQHWVWGTSTWSTWNELTSTSTTILSATATLDFPVIAAGETERLTTTVTGAALLDPVLVSGPTGIYNSNNSEIDGWVSAANTVTVRVRNNGASSIDPGEGQFKIKVFK